MARNDQKDSGPIEESAVETFRISSDGIRDLAGKPPSELTIEEAFKKKIIAAMISDDKAVAVTIFDTRGGVETIPVPTTQNLEKFCLIFDNVPAVKESVEPTIEPIFYEKFKHLVAPTNFDKNRDGDVETEEVSRI